MAIGKVYGASLKASSHKKLMLAEARSGKVGAAAGGYQQAAGEFQKQQKIHRKTTLSPSPIVGKKAPSIVLGVTPRAGGMRKAPAMSNISQPADRTGAKLEFARNKSRHEYGLHTNRSKTIGAGKTDFLGRPDAATSKAAAEHKARAADVLQRAAQADTEWKARRAEEADAQRKVFKERLTNYNKLADHAAKLSKSASTPQQHEAARVAHVAALALEQSLETGQDTEHDHREAIKRHEVHAMAESAKPSEYTVRATHNIEAGVVQKNLAGRSSQTKLTARDVSDLKAAARPFGTHYANMKDAGDKLIKLGLLKNTNGTLTPTEVGHAHIKAILAVGYTGKEGKASERYGSRADAASAVAMGRTNDPIKKPGTTVASQAWGASQQAETASDNAARMTQQTQLGNHRYGSEHVNAHNEAARLHAEAAKHHQSLGNEAAIAKHLRKSKSHNEMASEMSAGIAKARATTGTELPVPIGPSDALLASKQREKRNLAKAAGDARAEGLDRLRPNNPEAMARSPSEHTAAKAPQEAPGSASASKHKAITKTGTSKSGKMFIEIEGRKYYGKYAAIMLARRQGKK